MSYAWLPERIYLDDYGGDWSRYETALYEAFKEGFVDSKPAWPLQRVALKKQPISAGKEATFWHMISTGETEEARVIDVKRCEAIRWPRAMMDEFAGRRPGAADRILWWKTKRGNEWRYVLATRDFGYVCIVADRGEYVLPWTAYFVEESHTRRKLERQYVDYWSGNG